MKAQQIEHLRQVLLEDLINNQEKSVVNNEIVQMETFAEMIPTAFTCVNHMETVG